MTDLMINNYISILITKNSKHYSDTKNMTKTKSCCVVSMPKAVSLLDVQHKKGIV